MKAKLLYFTCGLQLIAAANYCHAQFKLFNTGCAAIGTVTPPPAKTQMQVVGNLNYNPLILYANDNLHNSYSGINSVNDTTTKAWAVQYGGQDKFYVLGSGQCYGYGYYSISDSSLKMNVRNIHDGLDKVMELQGVTYRMKSEPGKPQMGLLAQSVQRVAPEAVSSTPEGIKTVAYGNLVALLVEAVKEENVKVNRLEHELDSCKTVLSQIKH